MTPHPLQCRRSRGTPRRGGEPWCHINTFPLTRADISASLGSRSRDVAPSRDAQGVAGGSARWGPGIPRRKKRSVALAPRGWEAECPGWSLPGKCFLGSPSPLVSYKQLPPQLPDPHCPEGLLSGFRGSQDMGVTQDGLATCPTSFKRQLSAGIRGHELHEV